MTSAQPESTKEQTGRKERLAALVRHVFNKRTLKIAAPLLMTTALVSDSQDRTIANQPVWGHSVAPQDGANWPQSAASESIRNVVRCYEPRQTEAAYALQPSDRSWHGFHTLSTQAGATGKFLHAAVLRDKISACLTTNRADNARYARTRQIGISNSDNAVDQLRSTAHGIAHALLLQTDQAETRADEQLSSRLSRRLMAEALAITVEYMVAAELRVQGNPEAWTMLGRENHPGFRTFQDALARHRFAFDGRPLPLSTLQAAATDTANDLMRQPDFIAFHADDIMRAALAEIALGQVQRPRLAATFNDSNARQLSVWHVAGQADVNLGGQIRLVSGEELARIARNTAARIEGLEHIKARKFGYTGPQGYIANNPYTSLKASDLSQWMERTQGRYTVSQAMTRVMNGNTRWDDRATINKKALQFGIQADYGVNQAPQQARGLWDSLQLMRRDSPLIAAPLIDHAGQHDVFMCYSETMHNASGLWVPNYGALFMNPSLRGEAFDSLPTLAHELMHAVQTRHAGPSFSANYSIYDLQANSLSREAAARTVSTLATIEMYSNGGLTRARADVDGHIFDTMIQAYEADTSANNRHALEAAGLAGYQQLFSVQRWLDSYNGRMISNFVGWLNSGALKSPEPGALNIDTLRRMGRVSDNLNFTRELRHLPTEIERFGDNVPMRQMFAWLHYQHLAKAFGPQSEQAMAERNLLQRDRNPYLRLDLAAFTREISGVGDAKYYLKIANRMVGLGPTFMIPPAGRQHSRLICS